MNRRCYSLWRLSIDIHSQRVAELYGHFEKIVGDVVDEVRKLNSGDPRLRIVDEVDYLIGNAYRNGIYLALNILTKIEESISNRPSVIREL